MCRMAHFGNCDPETANQEYCIFHKPDKSEEEAVEFYRKFLERFKPRVEEIEVDGQEIKRLVFEKKVDARGFVFPEIPNVSIEYTDGEGNKWEGRFSFEYAIFRDNAVFSSADFSRAAIIDSNPFGPAIDAFLSFEYATFYKLADFSEAKFDIARFLGAQFNHAIFKGTEFEYADFPWSRFKFANFTKARFYEKALFENSQFEEAHFEESRFNEGNFARTRFERAYFNDPILDYPGEIFTINEGWTEFRVVNFSGAEFNELSFGKVKIIEYVNFDGVVINGRATFIPLHHLISMETFNIPWELLDRDCFKRKCWKKWDFENSFIICNSRFCHPQPLAETAKMQRIIYERLGDREKSDSMFVLEMRAKRKLRMLQAKENLTNAKDFKNKLKAIMRYIRTWIDVQAEKVLADWITKYGTNWRRILKSSGFVILGTGFLYWTLSHFQTAKDPVLGIPIGTIYTDGASQGIPGFLNALYYSLVTFTTLGYGDMHPTGWLKALSALEALTGAVFMALIVAVIARKWMR